MYVAITDIFEMQEGCVSRTRSRLDSVELVITFGCFKDKVWFGFTSWHYWVVDCGNDIDDDDSIDNIDDDGNNIDDDIDDGDDIDDDVDNIDDDDDNIDDGDDSDIQPTITTN